MQQGKEAIRVEVLESLKDEKPNFADQKSREFWIRKKHLCFIMDVPVTFQDFSQELQLRSSSSQVMMTIRLIVRINRIPPRHANYCFLLTMTDTI